jgi:predicted nucleic acid-binding protein
VFDSSERAAAPDLLNAEILHAIRRLERRGLVDAAASKGAIADLADLPIVRYPTLSLLEHAWLLRANLSAYDAIYVALAVALDSALVTADAGLASAARRYGGATVSLVG